MAHYDYDLCCNETCKKRNRCERYITYKAGKWKFCYVMRGCISHQLFKERTE